MRDEKSRINDKLRKLQAQEQGLQECRAEVDGLERSLKYLEERLADSALMDEDDDVLAATASSCVENYSRLAISAQRPSERPKLGHDLRAIHATDWSEQHLTQTSRDPELKHKLNFDFHTGSPVVVRPGDVRACGRGRGRRGADAAGGGPDGAL